MSKREYYWRWIKTACRDVLHRIDLWYSLGGAALTVLRHVFPSMEAAIPDLGWQLLSWSCMAVIAMRVILAPYWIAKADAATIAAQQKEIDELTDKLKPRLVITRIVDETEPAQANHWLTDPGTRTVKIEVKNIGASILQECLVKLEDLISKKGHIHKWKSSQLRDKFVPRSGESLCAGVATLDEKDRESEITLHIQTPLSRNLIPRDDTYYFYLVAYSEGAPDRKRYKLYVHNDGQLTMEENQDGRS